MFFAKTIKQAYISISKSWISIHQAWPNAIIDDESFANGRGNMDKDENKTDKDENKTEARRKFLKTAGKFAVYTPPALMLMSKANANGIPSNGQIDPPSLQ